MRFSRREFLTFTGLGTALAFAEPFLVACAGIVGKPTKEISPTTPPLPDLTPTSEIDQQGGVNVARVQLTETAMGGEITGKANLEVIKRALTNFGFENGALEKGQVALWTPIESEKLLMYKVHKDTTEMFSIGRLYAYHTKAQRFLEVPILLRADLGADGSFLLKSVEAVSLDINTSEAKKRTYAVRTAALRVSDDEKKTVELESDPTISPRFSYDIESTIDGQNKPIIVGTRKYALGMLLADLKGSQINGDAAYANEAIFRRFVIPAQELGSFKEQPAVLRESPVSSVVQDEIAMLIADKKLSNSKVVSLSVEQWGGSTISSKDAAIVFTPDLTSDVVQTTSDAEKHKLQGKYYLAVKASKKIGSTDKIKTVSLSKQDDEWQLIEFPLQLVTRDDGNTYLELINDTFGVRLAVGVKVVDKKIQVLGDQLFAYAFSPAKMETQTSPLQVLGGELQKMLGGMKEVEKEKKNIIFEKRIVTNENINTKLDEVSKFNEGSTGAIVDVTTYGLNTEFLNPRNTYPDRFTRTITLNIILLSIKIEETVDGKLVAHLLYLQNKNKVNNAFVFRVEVPMENLIIEAQGIPGAASLKVKDEKDALSQIQQKVEGGNLRDYIMFASPSKKERNSVGPNESIAFPLTDSYQQFANQFAVGQIDAITSAKEFENELFFAWAAMAKKAGQLQSGDSKKMLDEIAAKEWTTSPDVPLLEISEQIFIAPYVLHKSTQVK